MATVNTEYAYYLYDNEKKILCHSKYGKNKNLTILIIN